MIAFGLAFAAGGVLGLFAVSGDALARLAATLIGGGSAIGLFGAAAALAWLRADRKVLRRRVRQAAAPLSGSAEARDGDGAETVFRVQRTRSPWRRWLWDRIEARWPLLDAPRAASKALAAGVVGAAGCQGALWFLKVPGGPWSVPLCAAAGAAAAHQALSWLQARQAKRFVREFPETVDQIVRLSTAGVPALEAIAAVAEDGSPVVAPLLREVRDGLAAGLDSETALSAVARRMRIPEFTMFAAVIRLQQRSGGSLSVAFSNLAATLRERRRTALKAHASTAQSRLTILVLAAMPAVVLVGQNFTAPESVEMLFGTDQGTVLMRWGVGLIVAGILTAKAIVSRGTQ